MALVLKDQDEAQVLVRTCKDWVDTNDSLNPRVGWSLTRKILSTVIVIFVGFVCTMTTSIYAPGHEQVKKEFGVSTTVSLLPLSAYTLGLAFGPMISSPLSETFGRKFVYLLTIPLFDIFVLATGFSQSISTLIICRLFAGMFAAPGVSVASATIADFTYPDQRAIPFAFYYTAPTLGSAIGPLIGAFVVEAKGWRWTSWTSLIFAAALHPPVLYLRESYKLTILQRKAKSLAVEGPSAHSGSMVQLFKHFATTTIIRPIHMILTEPLVGYVCLYTSFQFALLFTFVVALPWVFATTYSFSARGQGLSFLGLIIGCCIAPFVLISIDIFVYRPRQARARQRHHDENPSINTTIHSSFSSSGDLPPEHRLLPALYGSLVLPTGLFLFAFTARSSISPIIPIASQSLIMLGSILIYVPCNIYLIEVYGSAYGASSAGASSLCRYTMTSAFPLFATVMYERLGVVGATCLLGGVSLVLAPIPWVFWWWGKGLRARSGYEHGT